jgi:DNA-binding SARP family transcriptional activator
VIRTMATIRTCLGMAALLVGVPLLLLAAGGGSPLPDRPPTVDQIHTWLEDPLHRRYAAATVRTFAWVGWAGIAGIVIIAAGGRLRRWRWHRLSRYVPGPIQTVAATLVGAASVTAAGSGAQAHPALPAAAAVPDPHRALDTSPPQQDRNASPHCGTPMSPDTGSTSDGAWAAAAVTVRPGDSLSTIAERRLGDPDRWPAIFTLNRGRQLPGGGVLTDPDLIHPGWRLTLPGRPHRAAEPPQHTPAGDGARHGPGQPGPTAPTAAASTPTSAPRSPATTTGGIVVPTTPPAGHPRTPATPPRATGPASAPNAPLSDSASTDGPADPGVLLPAGWGWISLPFAGFLAAAGAMVWLRRRHRYIPRTSNRPAADDPSLQPLPPVMRTVNREVRRRTPESLEPVTAPPTVAEYTRAAAADRPALPPVGPDGLDLAGLAGRVPPNGLGLAGPGAPAAARALLVATLSAGTPADPDARSQAIVTADTLTALLGAAAATLTPTPRLHVTTNLADALTRVEELLVERHRLLAEYDTTDVTALRAADPFHPPLPPVLLLCEPPHADLHDRLTATTHVGHSAQISTVLLGEWAPGDTTTVAPDGQTTGGRLAVLDVPTTHDLLGMLHEAHTGDPAPAPSADAVDPPVLVADKLPQPREAPPDEISEATPAEDTGTAVAVTAIAPSAEADPRTAVRVRLLGKPAILDHGGVPVTGLRHHARELLAYLAVHRGGAGLPDIMEAMWPHATVRRAAERLSTEVADLRRRIRQAADNPAIQPVVNTGGRYHLDGALLDIDVWHVTDMLRDATTADPATRADLLRQAITAYGGPLAEGYDYDWIDPAREQLRRDQIRARTALADLIADDQPRAAADLLTGATVLDPINEDLARRAIRALAVVDDQQGAHAVFDRLRDALADIDEQPSPETVALEVQLRRPAAEDGPLAPTSGGRAQPPADPGKDDPVFKPSMVSAAHRLTSEQSHPRRAAAQTNPADQMRSSR